MLIFFKWVSEETPYMQKRPRQSKVKTTPVKFIVILKKENIQPSFCRDSIAREKRSDILDEQMESKNLFLSKK